MKRPADMGGCPPSYSHGEASRLTVRVRCADIRKQRSKKAVSYEKKGITKKRRIKKGRCNECQKVKVIHETFRA